MDCLSGYTKTSKTCSQTADQGYNECSQSADEGYNSCQSKYYNECHWYSPWNCIAGWVCSAWTWVSNIVCVAWTWISNVVCVAWNVVTTFVCVLWDVITMLANAILVTIESILAPILNAIAGLIQFVFAIPILGRFLSWVWNIVTALVYGIASIFDAIAWLIGIRPEKRLLLLVLNQLDEQRQPVASDADLTASIGRLIQVYQDDANVRVLPVKPFYYRTPFSEGQQASEDYVVTISQTGTPHRLDVSCGGSNAASDLGFAGADFQNILTLSGFWTNWRRLIGYGAPICAFSVRSFSGTSDGCSNGPLDDFVLVNFSGAATDVSLAANAVIGKSSILPHESGHACNLWHVDPPNLMQGSDPRMTNLSTWQVVLLRASRHVTYF
jgi:hypothetical protein